MPSFLIVELRESVGVKGESQAVEASVVSTSREVDVNMTLAFLPGSCRRHPEVVTTLGILQNSASGCVIEKSGRDLVNGTDGSLPRWDLSQEDLRSQLHRIILR